MASRNTRTAASIALLLSTALSVASVSARPDDRAPVAQSGAQEMFTLGLRGVYFAPNHGQWADDEVIYGLKSRGLDVAFRESSFTMHLSRVRSEQSEPGCVTPTSAARHSSDRIQSGSRSLLDADVLTHEAIRGVEDSAPAYEHLTLTVSFPGSNPVTPRGAKPQAAKFNYFVGGEGHGVASNVPSFGAVIYENLYDGVNLLVCGNDDGVMKYEFHCAPGADYSQIRIQYDGIDSLCVNVDGDLEIATSFGTLRDGAPIVWQEDAAIPARFELIDDHTYRIALDGPVDQTLALVIDPDVEWMYYLGGSAVDIAWSVALDDNGNALIAGETKSLDFKGRNNVLHHPNTSDAFLAKIGVDSQLLWMTYLGGTVDDYARGVVADRVGNALVTGITNSANFQGHNNAYHLGSSDAFVAKVDPVGQLEWATFLGGTNTDYGRGIAADEANNAFVTGLTTSVDFEGHLNSFFGGLNDAFVARIGSSGQLDWMTYLGGRNIDDAYGVSVDDNGATLVAGSTRSSDFTVRRNLYRGAYDAFLVSVAPTGQPAWMIYLGGSLDDLCHDLAVGDDDSTFVAGYSESTDFEGRINAPLGRYDAYVIKVGASQQVDWMVYLGGSDDDTARAVDTIGAGNVWIAGETQSTDFQGSTNGYHGGTHDGFVLSVTDVGSLISAAYLGGTDRDECFGVATAGSMEALATGRTQSLNFAGRNNSYHGGDYDAFIVKLRIADGPQLTVAATCPSGGPIQVSWSGATPNGQVALIFARNTGSFIIPNNRPCAGTELGLGNNQIQVAWQGGAGAEGSRTLNTNAGPGACGGHLQLLDLSTCTTSNVARIE